MVGAFEPPFEDVLNDRVDCSGRALAARVRPNRAARLLVDPAAARVARFVDLHRLCDVGGVPGRPLQLRTVYFTVLLAGDLWHLSTQLVRPQTGGLAGVASLLAGAAHPPDPRAFPVDVLL